MQILKCVVSYSIMWCVVYGWMCIMVLRGWIPICEVDNHYVIMFTSVHTLTPHACLHVV